MYCFEALKCTKYDCPVQREQAKRCWQYLEALNGRPVEPEDCPYGPCKSCNYRLGWEIGLIGDSMFPDVPDPTPESIVPPKAADQPAPQADSGSSTQETISEPQQQDKAQANKKELSSKESSPSSPPQKVKIQQTSQPKQPAKVEKEEQIELPDNLQTDNLGKPGMRFCHEILECPNPKCPVRRRQIIQCFKFFSGKRAKDKAKITCTDRECATCFYQKGWQLGLLSEDLFADILEKKRLKIEKADRIKRNSLVEIYLAELAKKPLTRAEEYELAQKIAGDKEASELFLLANLKLVMRVAKRFSNKGLGLMDLIQEGNIGLIKAIAKFDHTLGYRFSTYAAYWIRYYMQKALRSQASSIRVPYHLLTVAHKIKRRIQEFEFQFYRSPTLTELSELMALSEEKILSIIRITQSPISIHAKNSDDNETSLEYYLTDKKTLTPEEATLEKLKNETIVQALNMLPDRLQFVVKNFYGFNEDELSLAEIGRRLNISRERARQLLRQALRKLQQGELVTDLKSFLD